MLKQGAQEDIQRETPVIERLSEYQTGGVSNGDGD